MIAHRVGPITRIMEAFFEWMNQARSDATLMALYSRIISWADIPMNEPLILEEVVVETTEESSDIRVTTYNAVTQEQ
jgi:hypothetical protein